MKIEIFYVDNINNCDNDACNNINESDELGVKNVATDVNSMELDGGYAVPEKKARMFILRLVNSFGSTDLDEISDDGIPIKFNSRRHAFNFETLTKSFVNPFLGEVPEMSFPRSED